jgi:uncharacterized integral membrane protein
MSVSQFFKYFLKAITIITLVAFIVLNRQETDFYISPITDPLTLPLWLLGIVLFTFGFLMGALLLWLNSWPIKKELRQTKKDLQHTQEKYEDLASLRPPHDLIETNE